MNILFVVSQEQDWPFDIPGIEAISAQTYLMDPAYGECGPTKVFNLCRAYRYQNDGYYVSLLAEARGHRPVPDVEAIRDLQSEDLLPDLGAKLGDLIDCSLSRVEADVVDLDIYFGRDAGGRHEHLCRRLFELLRAPLLHVRLERLNDRWRLCSVHAGSLRDVPRSHHELATDAARSYLKQQKIRMARPPGQRPAVAILHDPRRADSPSNRAALEKFAVAARQLGMRTELLTARDCHRLADFDALFIRETTGINHHTYRISRQAADAGLVVIDDPDSILRCTNKIYLSELLIRHHLPTPKAMLVHRGNIDQIGGALGLPCILKQPDGAFSVGVVKVESEAELLPTVEALLEKSELVLAQEYLPTDYDWRIGVLDGRVLFACKYYMASGHWQIIKHEQQQMSEGRTEALAVGEVPDDVVRIALQAAALIGDGFYGVDLKQVGSQVYVIEINDNPNVDAGNEDGVLGDALYREVMGVFRKRIEALKGNSTA
ncbi:Glutathione synthase/RimK-type ligase, ATP-grasp superfamily [Noviherbaspirillum humi]|uniref:Glutathione synthase/RimK-type ligase, ATP-grasp superfamily n=1 Tax=Noviherbaspirillum humi TaxID=1688639 RepID=A0A239DTN9_9BURK|nr:RimK family protein [Noviherbaspirillum humi]SNS35268.1 Glutathione synthase/RimK-type ligase, ATP-grasp superfamily [Noviherbaspirillum humi]